MKTSLHKTFSSTAKASSQVSSIGSFTWSSQLYWLQPIRLGFAMMKQLTLDSLIERVSLPRFGWLVRRMQKGYDWNTMQCAVTFLINNPKKSIWFSDCQRGGSWILPCFESRQILSHGRRMAVEWCRGYRVTSYESLAGQFTWVKNSLLSILSLYNVLRDKFTHYTSTSRFRVS